jgi:hypothetical protein
LGASRISQSAKETYDDSTKAHRLLAEDLAQGDVLPTYFDFSPGSRRVDAYEARAMKAMGMDPA